MSREEPPDRITGVDPAFTLTAVQLPGYRCACGDEGSERNGQQHLDRFHPATRNPDITCRADSPDGAGWPRTRCERPKDHDGPHWHPRETAYPYFGPAEWL